MCNHFLIFFITHVPNATDHARLLSHDGTKATKGSGLKTGRGQVLFLAFVK
jgi:hypothetical protein